MSVFKVYMKIAKKNIGMILLYLVIFFGVTVMFQRFAGEEPQGYTTESIPVGIVDEDGGTAAESLIDYIGLSNDVVLLENDTESLQEELFYRNVDYIVRIPEGFMEKCIRGDESLKVTAVPGTYTGHYAEQQISNFINFARSYAAAGFTEEEIASVMAERTPAEVNLLDQGGNGGQTPSYAFFYRYLPYLFLSLLCYVMGYILMGFRRGSLPRRMRASAVPARRQSLEGLAASGVIALALWGICTAASLTVYGRGFLTGGRAGWYLLNSFVLLIVSLTLAYLVGTLVKTSDALNGSVNILSLGMCFLCGVFVEMDYLSGGVRKAAQFLPVYWYETVNDLLTQSTKIAGSVRTEVLEGIGIQLVFAAAFVCVTLAVTREKKQNAY